MAGGLGRLDTCRPVSAAMSSEATYFVHRPVIIGVLERKLAGLVACQNPATPVGTVDLDLVEVIRIYPDGVGHGRADHHANDAVLGIIGSGNTSRSRSHLSRLIGAICVGQVPKRPVVACSVSDVSGSCVRILTESDRGLKWKVWSLFPTQSQHVCLLITCNSGNQRMIVCALSPDKAIR